MALIWEKKTPLCHYQVRQAGASVRLYSNGIFHSQWNPRQPLASTVWHCLFAAMFFLKDIKKPCRVLVLGVGGGAVINLFNHYLKPQSIQGVDLDKQHLFIAKKFFGLRQKNIKLHYAEAQSWLQEYRCEKFDLIVEDLFCGATANPSDACRAIEASAKWLNLLNKHLAKDGVLAMNFESRAQVLNSSGITTIRRTKKSMSCFTIEAPAYENAIALVSKSGLSLSEFKRQMREFPELDDRRTACKIKLKVRPLARLV